MTVNIQLDFHRRAIQRRIDQAIDALTSDLAFIGAAHVQDAAPRASGFLAESVQALPVKSPGAPGRTETRADRVYQALPAPPPPESSSSVHVGARYAIHVQLRQPFVIGPALHSALAVLPALCDRHRLT
jgi:hypothetical protein